MVQGFHMGIRCRKADKVIKECLLVFVWLLLSFFIPKLKLLGVKPEG